MFRVSTHEVGERNSSGVGFLLLPENQDRDSYVNTAIRTQRIILGLQDGGVIDNVILSKNVVPYLKFPVTQSETGSQVIWVNIPKYNIPVVIAVIADNGEVISDTESGFSFQRSLNNGIVEVSGNAKQKVITLKVDALSGSGQLNIIATGSSKINISSGNEVNVKAKKITTNSNEIELKVLDPSVDEKETIISYKKGVGLSYKDEFNNEIIISKSNIQVKGIRIQLGQGKEPLVLGNTLQSLLTELIGAIEVMTFTNSGGPTAVPNNVAQFRVLKAKLATMLSQLSNTD